MDERLQVSLGAIYTLREIERDFPDLAGAVFELLSAYIREKSPSYGIGSLPRTCARSSPCCGIG